MGQTEASIVNEPSPKIPRPTTAADSDVLPEPLLIDLTVSDLHHTLNFCLSNGRRINCLGFFLLWCYARPMPDFNILHLSSKGSLLLLRLSMNIFVALVLSKLQVQMGALVLWLPKEGNSVHYCYLMYATYRINLIRNNRARKWANIGWIFNCLRVSSNMILSLLCTASFWTYFLTDTVNHYGATPSTTHKVWAGLRLLPTWPFFQRAIILLFRQCGWLCVVTVTLSLRFFMVSSVLREIAPMTSLLWTASWPPWSRVRKWSFVQGYQGIKKHLSELMLNRYLTWISFYTTTKISFYTTTKIFFVLCCHDGPWRMKHWEMKS